MEEIIMVRNSRILGLLDVILHDDRIDFRAVEIVGRGIAAEARCLAEIFQGKSERFDDSQESANVRVLDYSDRLIELGDIEDGIEEALRSRLAEARGNEDFLQFLEDLVVRLENWPISAR